MEIVPGTLYIVATPIGNLEDITVRALAVLNGATIIAAEDTRVVRKLMSRYEIHGDVTSYHDHNKDVKAPVLLQRIADGASVALVSDAGTPLIADPGYFLVSQAHEQGVPVVPIPGACAVPTALSAAGQPTDSHVFIGYLPNRGAARRARLLEVADLPYTVVCYESPHRLLKALTDIGEVLGERPLTVCRELTKLYEEIIRGTPETLLEHFGTGRIRGELTLVISSLSRRQLRARERAAAKAARGPRSARPGKSRRSRESRSPGPNNGPQTDPG